MGPRKLKMNNYEIKMKNGSGALQTNKNFFRGYCLIGSMIYEE